MRNVTDNNAPIWAQPSYDTGLTIQDLTDDPKTIFDLSAVSSDEDGDTITYSVESVSSPGGVEDNKFMSSLFVENGILKIENLITNDPNNDGLITITVKASDGTAFNNADISFTFQDVQ